MTYAQSLRLAFIDWRLLVHGSVRRQHIIDTFGVSMVQASNDIKTFIAEYPDATEYDKSEKQYVPNGRYKSVTGWTPHKLMAWAAAAKAGVEWAWG